MIYDLDADLVLGRGDRAEIQLDDPFASARHARVYQQGNIVVIEDLGSTNGTYLNEELLETPRPLHPGDRVRIVETSPAPIGAVTSGKSIQVRAAVDLAGLKPTDVRVEAVQRLLQSDAAEHGLVLGGGGDLAQGGVVPGDRVHFEISTDQSFAGPKNALFNLMVANI